MINQVLGHVTYVDRTQAFLLYTVDKIVASLIKQVGITFFYYALEWDPSLDMALRRICLFLPFRCKRSYPTTSARSCGNSLDATDVRYPSRDKIS